MTRVLVDVGNSSIKWCTLTDGLGVVHRCGRSPESLSQSLAAQAFTDGAVWLSSVADDGFNQQLEQSLRSLGFETVHFASTPTEAMGLVNSYAEPQRMGVDRWLAMLAAWVVRKQAVVVVDVGTALTIDLIDANGRHEGGYILPGANLMSQALLRDTQRVRFDEEVSASITPGRTTGSCVAAGVWAAMLGSVRLVLQSHPDHAVVVTGGDGQALLALGINGEWRPHLVFEGLALSAGELVVQDA